LSIGYGWSSDLILSSSLPISGLIRTGFDSTSMLHFIPCGDSLPISISGVQPRVSVQEDDILPYTPTPGGYPGGGSVHVFVLGFELCPCPGHVTLFRVGFDQAFHRPSQMAFQEPFNLPFILAFKRRLEFRPDPGSEAFSVVFSVVFSLVSSLARSLIRSPCPPADLTRQARGLQSRDGIRRPPDLDGDGIMSLISSEAAW